MGVLTEGWDCDFKRQFNRARLIALAEREGLAVFGTRIQCPRKCSDDKRGVAVSESPSGALWSCDRCKAGGTVIDLLIATRGLSEKEVIMQIRSPEFMSNIPEPSRKLQTPKPIMDGAVLWKKLADRDSHTEEYLRSRGLGDAIPFVKFNIGNTEDYWLDLMARKGFRLAVPLRNKIGAVMDFQIRSICPLPADKDGKTPSAKRSLRGSPRPRHTVFGRPDLIGAGKPIFVTEGMADTLALQIAVQWWVCRGVISFVILPIWLLNQVRCCLSSNLFCAPRTIVRPSPRTLFMHWGCGFGN